MTYAIELKNISKSFDENIILKNFNLNIRSKEFVTILGPSGCGKTTLLRIIAGFEYPDDGQVVFDGEIINNVPPYKRNVNTVFQKYALFPNMTVKENIAFGLKLKKLSKKIIDDKVSEILRLVNLLGYENRNIEGLSGGQQQRIAIARALVNEPKILLLDEPLGALDLKLRKGMQVELKNIQERIGITFIFVTHDQEEALSMSDTIVVLNEGEIQQIGSPVDIYNEPKNSFVANFIGESNILEGVMNEDKLVTFLDNKFICVDKGFKKDEKVDVVIRPEDIELLKPSNNYVTGIVESVTFKGVHYEMIVKVRKSKLMVQSTLAKKINSEVGIRIDPDNIHIMEKVISDEV